MDKTGRWSVQKAEEKNRAFDFVNTKCAEDWEKEIF